MVFFLLDEMMMMGVSDCDGVSRSGSTLRQCRFPSSFNQNPLPTSTMSCTPREKTLYERRCESKREWRDCE